jgi:hypothetical protein
MAHYEPVALDLALASAAARNDFKAGTYGPGDVGWARPPIHEELHRALCVF